MIMHGIFESQQKMQPRTVRSVRTIGIENTIDITA
jgi:hypothetical protein